MASLLTMTFTAWEKKEGVGRIGEGKFDGGHFEYDTRFPFDRRTYRESSLRAIFFFFFRFFFSPLLSRT